VAQKSNEQRSSVWIGATNDSSALPLMRRFGTKWKVVYLAYLQAWEIQLRNSSWFSHDSYMALL